MSFGHWWFIILPNHTEFDCFWCWLLYAVPLLSRSDIVCIAAIGVVLLGFWLRSGLLSRMPCYCASETRDSEVFTLPNSQMLCVFMFSFLWVHVFVLSFRAARLERSDTIRCIKSCQPNDVACILDPTHSISHTIISLPTFREFTKPEGRC